jgi:energy-converting hydrogenase Eha subunit A
MKRNPADSAAHHERLTSPQTGVQLSSDRTFGLVFAVFLALVWGLPLLRRGAPRWWSLGLSALFLLAAFASPRLLHPLNILWGKLAILLHHIVSPVAMALVFFLAFTPIGLLLRVFGKDLLRLRRDPQAETYWLRRDPPGPAPETMVRQF